MLEAYLFIIDQLSKVWETAQSWYIFPGVNLLFASALLLILHVVIILFIPSGLLGLGNHTIARANNEKYKQKSKSNNKSSSAKGG